MARPRLEIDQDQFQKLCALQCTLREIAGWFKCSEDTIENWCKRTYTDENDNPIGFSEVYKKYSVEGKISLRRFQFRMAEKNPSMAIWLGKQWLGQRDQLDMDVDMKGQSKEVEALEHYFEQRKSR